METAEALVSARKGQLASAQSLFNAGEVDRLALLSAQLELDASALSRLDALVKAQQSLHLSKMPCNAPRPLEAFAASPAMHPGQKRRGTHETEARAAIRAGDRRRAASPPS